MKAILIVEDDITFGMMLKTWLGKKGFEVSSVSNIARARKHIESQTVDLVLSDLRLPDYEGIDLLKWMNDRGLDIPLIIMTGYADIQSAVLAMKLQYLVIYLYKHEYVTVRCNHLLAHFSNNSYL